MAFRVAHAATPPIEPRGRSKKDAGYLKWLHQLPCVLTGRYGVQAAHISYTATRWGCYGRGKGTKVSDLFALPLNAESHALQHSGKLGSEESFWAHYGIDPHELCVVLWAIYSQYEPEIATAKATARINQYLASVGRLKDRSTV